MVWKAELLILSRIRDQCGKKIVLMDTKNQNKRIRKTMRDLIWDQNNKHSFFSFLSTIYRALKNKLNRSYVHSCLEIICFVFLTSVPGMAQDGNAAKEPVPLDITVSVQGPESGTVVEGQPFDWEIQIRWYGGAGELAPEIQKSPQLIGLELLKPSTTLRTGTEDGRQYTEKVFRYKLVAQTDGDVTIGSSAIRYNLPGDENESFLNASSSSYTAKPAPFSFREWLAKKWQSGWFRGIVIIFLIAAGICVTLVLLRRYKKTLPEIPAQETDPVEDAFEAARRSRIEGDRSRFIHAVKEAVRQSMARRFPEISSNELSEYRETLELEMQWIFDRFIEQCEQLQFAPVSPSPDELDRVLEDAKRLTETK